MRPWSFWLEGSDEMPLLRRNGEGGSNGSGRTTRARGGLPWPRPRTVILASRRQPVSLATATSLEKSTAFTAATALLDGGERRGLPCRRPLPLAQQLRAVGDRQHGGVTTSQRPHRWRWWCARGPATRQPWRRRGGGSCSVVGSARL